IKYKSSSAENCEVISVSHSYDEVKKFVIEDGRYFTEAESNTGKAVAVIGNDVKEALFPDEDAVGKDIIVRGSRITIIGTITKEGSSLVENSSDDCVLI